MTSIICNDNSRRLCDSEECKICYEKSFASHSRASCWSEENDKKPREVFKSSHNKYKIVCDICNHLFESSLYNITGRRNCWCPYCASKKLCDSEECNLCYVKSFASHPRASCWSEENDKKPREVFKSSHNKYKIVCDICNHLFESRPHDITGGNCRCPYCSNPPQKLCDAEQCKSCYVKSFASHPRASCWSEENDKKPREVFKSSHNKYKIVCDICNHLFESSLYNITGRRNCWCPYCASKKLCDSEECNLCYVKSFASHPRASCWSEENDKKPREVFKSSANKYKIVCDICNHLFESSLYNITGRRNCWCPRCVNKTELKLYIWLITNYPETSREKTFDWCIKPNTNRYYRFDFFIPEKNILIELDGPQHFKQVSNWNCCRDTQQTDIYKMKKANENGFTTIRALQEDIFNDRYDWKNELTNLIDKIYENPAVLYICKKNEYDSHQELYNTVDISNIELEDEDDDENESKCYNILEDEENIL